MKTALTNEVILNICLWKSNSGDQEAGPLPQASSCFCPSVQRSKDQRRLALLWDQRQRSELSRTSSPSMQCTRQSSFSTRSAGYCQTSPWTALGTYWITTALCACLLQGSRSHWSLPSACVRRSLLYSRGCHRASSNCMGRGTGASPYTVGLCGPLIALVCGSRLLWGLPPCSLHAELLQVWFAPCPAWTALVVLCRLWFLEPGHDTQGCSW